jgi:hypothetical protein
LGRWIVTKSACAYSSADESAFSAPSSRNRSALTNGSNATIRIPNARARAATSCPIRPNPSTPSVFSYTSTPPNRDRSHFPPVSDPCACGMLRASASINAIVCSAAATMFDCGAFATMIPRFVAASTSTLSTPIPARPITFNLSARSIRSAVSCVADRIRIPWYWPIRSASSAGDRSSPRSTSNRSRSRSTPESAIFSATRTL